MKNLVNKTNKLISANHPQKELFKLQKELKRKNQKLAEQEESEKNLALINQLLQEDLKVFTCEKRNTFEASTTKSL